MPIKISDTVITAKSILSHRGMRVAGSVIAVTPLAAYLREYHRSGYDFELIWSCD
jgi:hypothetical protein